MNKSQLNPQLAIIIVALLWSITLPLSKKALFNVSPNIFVFTRFALSSVIIFPLLWFNKGRLDKKILLAGLFLGLLNSGMYLFQLCGLKTIDAPRAAFLSNSYVFLVPFIMQLFKLGSPSIWDYTASAITLLGSLILTGTNISYISSGDLYIIASAALYAVYIVFIHWIIPKIGNRNNLLSFISIPCTLFMLMPLCTDIVFIQFDQFCNANTMIALLFCSIGATIIGLYLQMNYQYRIKVYQASLIYSLIPVFTCIFSYFINHEVITMNTIMGGSIILLSLVVSSISSRSL